MNKDWAEEYFCREYPMYTALEIIQIKDKRIITKQDFK